MAALEALDYHERVQILALKKEISEQTCNNLEQYLSKVDVGARPKFLTGVASFTKTDDTFTTGFDVSKEQYRAKAQQANKDKIDTPHEHQVLFNQRTLKDFKGPAGVIEVFPQDFVRLSFAHYVKLFGEGRKEGYDPWVAKGFTMEASIDEVGLKILW